MDRFAKYGAVASVYRGAELDLELVTTLHKDDGTSQEISHARRVVCKQIVRKKNVTVLTLADIDLAALDQVYPFKTFTTADFPNVFVNAVGNRIPDGVGYVFKVPLVLVDTDGSTFWTYAGPQVVGSPATWETVYRGTQAGQGAIVDTSEYTTGTKTGASTGVVVNTVTFTREQIDFSGQQYVLEADLLLPGSRTPSDEISRILTAFGVTPDSTTFAAAATNDSGSFYVDALYGGNGRTGTAILTDLCTIARAWLVPTSTGAWAIMQDIAKSQAAQFDTSCDLLDIQQYGDADPSQIKQTITVMGRPKTAFAEDYAVTLQRTTSASTGELQVKNPYLYDLTTMDRIACYWQKRTNAQIGPVGGVAQGTIYATQLGSGDRISITDAVNWLGTKDFILPGIKRGQDVNTVTLREYVADVYVYTAGTLPADATQGYSPDYSFTPPLAPTSGAAVSGGAAASSSGVVMAWELVHALPPAVNWATLTAQITNTNTNEIYVGKLVYNPVSGYYETTITNMPPNEPMSLVFWATNVNGIDGATTTPITFTSATTSAVPAAPASATIGQSTSNQLDYSWATVAMPTGGAPIDHYVVEESVGGGGFTTVATVPAPATTFKRDVVTVGSTYQIRVHAVDSVGNAGSTVTSGTKTAAKVIDDTHVAGAGISGASIANSSITRALASTATGSSSGTFPASTGALQINMQTYTFSPSVYTTGAEALRGGSSALGNDTGTVSFQMISNTDGYDVRWRYIVP